MFLIVDLPQSVLYMMFIVYLHTQFHWLINYGHEAET
jgi:hypothetical protein